MTRKLFHNYNELKKRYNYVEAFYENKAVVEKNNKYGFVQRTGENAYEEIVAPQYKKAERFIGGFALVVGNDSKTFFINEKGEECFKSDELIEYEPPIDCVDPRYGGK